MDATHHGQTQMESVVLAEQKINSPTSHTIDLRQSEMSGMTTSSTDSPASQYVGIYALSSRHCELPLTDETDVSSPSMRVSRATVSASSSTQDLQ
ncbi:hypothetical protein LTR16_000356, partial [Cryomyces antarcticus]